MPSHYIVAYVSLVVFGFLNFGVINSVDSVGLSSSLINIIGLFVATNLACLKEFLTGTPAVSTIVPVLLVLAPGSVVVLKVLKVMQIDANVPGETSDSDIVTYLWLLGVTYSLGMYIALALWKPLLLKRGVSASILEKVKENRRRSSVVVMGEKKLGNDIM